MLSEANGQSQSHAAVNVRVPVWAARGRGAGTRLGVRLGFFTFYQSISAVSATMSPASPGDRHARVLALVQAISQFWGLG